MSQEPVPVNGATTELPATSDDVALPSPSAAPAAEAKPSPSPTLKDRLNSNPYLTAGFGVVALTASLALARSAIKVASNAIVQHYLVTLEIPITDEAFAYFLKWMPHHQRQLAFPSSSLSSSSAPSKPLFERALDRFKPRSHFLSVETTTQKRDNGSVSTEFSLVPGIGNHILRYHNAFIRVNRHREMKTTDLRGQPFETVSLTTLYSQRHVFHDILLEAQNLALKSQEGKTVLYTAWGVEWKPFGQPRKKRPLDSVVLDRGVKETIVDDVRDFLHSAKWYTDRGIPYRRGYLLHGPPGSGKSSFIQALAGEFDYSICLLNLSERGLTDDKLNHLLSNLPSRALVLLEDVDAAFANRRLQTNEDGYRGANVTFSGLLNALDGVVSAEERILFLTTNHPERLDNALIRPGRVDFEKELGMATEWQAGKMFERFYSREGEGGAVGAIDKAAEAVRDLDRLKEEFVTRLRDAGAFGNAKENNMGLISTAQLQGLFVFYKRSPAEAVKMAPSLVQK